MAATIAQSRPSLRRTVLLFFFISGLTSLILEVVWTRVLGAVFGNTVLASSTVLTAFMLGLALGSTLLGRWADRSSRPLMLAAVALTPSNIFWDVVNSYHAPSRIAFFREHSTGTPARTSPLQ